jgi:hypothetical protein
MRKKSMNCGPEENLDRFCIEWRASMAKNIRPIREQFDTQTELLDVAAKKMITSWRSIERELKAP